MGPAGGIVDLGSQVAMCWLQLVTHQYNLVCAWRMAPAGCQPQRSRALRLVRSSLAVLLLK